MLPDSDKFQSMILGSTNLDFTFISDGIKIERRDNQGRKLTFLLRRHLAPKFSEVAAKSKKLVAIFFFRKNEKKLCEKCII